MSRKKIEIPPSMTNCDKETQEFYVRCVQRGESPRLAEMLALRAAPRGMTDDVFFGGQTLAQQFGKDQRSLDNVIRGAKRHGYKPNYNDRYEPGLCRPDVGPGDPQAFIPTGTGRGYVRDLLQSRGWSGHGAVEVKGQQPEIDPWEKIEPIRTVEENAVLRKEKQQKKERDNGTHLGNKNRHRKRTRKSQRSA